jgi:hypothetical protein
MDIQAAREKYPQYDDMSDEELGRAVHKKFYDDLPWEVFAFKVGLDAANPSAGSPPTPTPRKPSLLPIKRVEDGQGLFGSTVDFGPSEFTDSIKRAVETPGQILSGEASMTPQEMNEVALETAGMAAGGPFASRAGRAAIDTAAEVAASPAIAEVVAGAANVARTASQRAGEVTGISRIFERVVDQLPSNVDKAAAKRLVQRLEQDGLSIDEIDNELKRLGELATIADAGGKNIQGQTRKLIQEPGKTNQLADEVLEPRQATQGTRVVDSVGANISDKQFYGEMDKIVERQKTIAAPLYREAFKANKSVESPLINRILETPAGKEAIAYARSRVQNRMSRMGEPDKELTAQLKELSELGLADPVKGGVARGLKLETLDLVKQALGDAEQAIKRKVISGNAKPGELKDMGDLRRAFTAELDRLDVTAKAGPNSLKSEGGAYARARKVWSDDASILDAMDMGRNFAKGDEELTARAFAKLSNAEKEAFRTGAAREMIATIRKTGMTPPALKNALRDTAIRDKIKVIAPTQRQFENFVNTLDREARFSQTNALRGGSQTGLLAAEGADMGMDFSGALISGMTGNPVGAGTSVISTALNWLKRAGIPQSVKDRMGEMLLSTDPAVQRRAMVLMRQMQTRKPDQIRGPSSLTTGGPK